MDDDEISISYISPTQKYLTIYVPEKKINVFLSYLHNNFPELTKFLHIRQTRHGYIVNIDITCCKEKMNSIINNIEKKFKTKSTLIGQILARYI